MRSCLLALLISASTVAPLAASDTRPLNVVVFLVDDLGWTDLGYAGSTFYETPRIDALAASGMRFTNGYAACQVCSPTRASMLTGKFPVRTGITDYINSGGANQPGKWNRPTKLLPAPYADRLAHEEVTLAEALKEAGYATFFAGKWHLGPEGHYPEDQGFDFNLGGLEQGGPYGGKKYFSPYGNKRLPDGPEGEHLPARLAAETAKFIEAHREKPFLAYLSFYSVHTPLIAREDLVKKYQEKKKQLAVDGPLWGKEGARQVRLVQEHAVYAGMVEAMDAAVGVVLDQLEKSQVADRTLVIFTSDNGGLSTSEGHPTSNLPLRAGKGWIYEGGLRVPLLVRLPGVTEPGSTCDAPVVSPDYYPTVLELAGLPPRPKQHVDGESIVPLLKGQSRARKPIFWHYPHYGNQGGAPTGAVRDGDWKLIEWYEDGRLELFNLAEDLGETRNVAESHGEIRDRLHALLVEWRKQTGAVMPKPRS